MKSKITCLVTMLFLLNAEICVAKSEQNYSLVPYLDYSFYRPTGQTLRIVPIEKYKNAELPEDIYPEWPDLDIAKLDKALLETIKRSQLFELKQSKARYELHTKLIGHRVIGRVSGVVIIMIRYVLIDTKSVQPIWKENILIHYHGYGGEREYANAVAVRMNLTKLIEKLSTLSIE